MLMQIHKSQKLIKSFLDRHGQEEWLLPVWSWNSKIDYISKMNRWNKLIFCMLVQIEEN